MALHTQRVSTLAWQDEAHVRDNRALYREKFDLFILGTRRLLANQQPDASFFLYPTIPPVDGLPHADDQAFTQWLYERTGVKILPGSFCRGSQKVSTQEQVTFALRSSQTSIPFATRPKKLERHWSQAADYAP